MQTVNLENKKEIKNLSFEEVENFMLEKYNNKQGLIVSFQERKDYASVQGGMGDEEKFITKKYQKGHIIVLEESEGGYASGHWDAYYGFQCGQEKQTDIKRQTINADIGIEENSICNGTDKQYSLLIPELGIDEFCSNATTQDLSYEEAKSWEEDIKQMITGIRYFTNAWDRKK